MKAGAIASASALILAAALSPRAGTAQQIDLTKLVASMGYDRTWMSLVDARLVDFDERVKAMDAAGVDVAVLSHTVPGAQGITDAALAAAAARDINDFLASAIARHPSRFAPAPGRRHAG